MLLAVSTWFAVYDRLSLHCRYSRSCPLYKKTCIAPDANGTNQAPVHVNVGNAGASFSWRVPRLLPVKPKP